MYSYWNQWPLPMAAICAAMLGVAAELRALEPADPRLAVDLPADVRGWYRNPDGSCVQCSLGMCGVDQNVPAAATLLWTTEYGPAERGGSGPERVARYCRSRGIRCYNVTGREAFEYMAWACRTGRGAAVGCGSIHMQSLFGHNPESKTWYVCNNNSPHKIDAYTQQQFESLCYASGLWAVVLDYPPHPARPEYRRWWETEADRRDLELFASANTPAQRDKATPVIAFAEGEVGAGTEVNTKEVLRRGNVVQKIGDERAGNPLLDAWGEVLAMPANDADKWYLYVLTDKGGAKSARCLEAFRTVPELRAFADQDAPAKSWSHFTAYTVDDESQKWRFERIKITATPTIIMQPPRTGRYGDPATVVFQGVWSDDAAGLAEALRMSLLKYLQALPNRPPLNDLQVGAPPCPDCVPPWKPAPKPGPGPGPGPDDARPSPFSPLVPPIDQLRPSSPWSWFGPTFTILSWVCPLFVLAVSFLAGALLCRWFLARAFRTPGVRDSSQRTEQPPPLS